MKRIANVTKEFVLAEVKQNATVKTKNTIKKLRALVLLLTSISAV
ncbi:MAG TPA: hypothetical protein VFI70_03690 [Nitrososphaeraceae archaeon]|nr:hypothetical protein [Nitrososphaeraceae archaeon]